MKERKRLTQQIPGKTQYGAVLDLIQGFVVVFKLHNLMPFLQWLLQRRSRGKCSRLASSQESGEEFKGQSHNFQIKIDLLNLDSGI